MDAARELDDLETAGDLTEGVAAGLAAFAHDDVGDLVGVVDEQLAEGVHDAGAFGQRFVGPLGLGCAGALNGALEHGAARLGQVADDLAGRGVVDGDGDSVVLAHLLAVDPVRHRDGGHGGPLKWKVGVRFSEEAALGIHVGEVLLVGGLGAFQP